MKRPVFLILLAVSLVGCQDQLTFHDKDVSPTLYSVDTVASKESLFSVQINERVVFPSETNFIAWTSIIGLEDRLNACDIPESIAKSMTTNALVESMIHYPLNYIILFCNNPRESVETIQKYSTLHKELLSREDVFELVLHKYADARPVKSRRMLTSENALMIEDDLFLGYYINVFLITQRSDYRIPDSVRDALEEKCEYILNALEPFDEILLEPIIRFSVKTGFSSNVIKRIGGEFLSYYQIRTPLFQTLDGILRSDFSDDVVAYYDSVAVANHPNAILRAHSDAQYNCHSFAWYQRMTSNQIWLNCVSPISYNFQLKKYWTDDYYEACSPGSGEIVYYPDGDHSAIVLTNGNLLSKWGSGPLMEHGYNDCDYISTNLQYFKEKSLPMNGFPDISGPSYVAPNVANTYIILNTTNSNIIKVVTAESLNPNVSCSLAQLGETTYSLVCSDYGAYRIIVHDYVYYNGVTINYSYSDKYVICSGSPMSQLVIDEEMLNSY